MEVTGGRVGMREKLIVKGNTQKHNHVHGQVHEHVRLHSVSNDNTQPLLWTSHSAQHACAGAEACACAGTCPYSWACADACARALCDLLREHGTSQWTNAEHVHVKVHCVLHLGDTALLIEPKGSACAIKLCEFRGKYILFHAQVHYAMSGE